MAGGGGGHSTHIYHNILLLYVYSIGMYYIWLCYGIASFISWNSIMPFIVSFLCSQLHSRMCLISSLQKPTCIYGIPQYYDQPVYGQDIVWFGYKNW